MQTQHEIQKLRQTQTGKDYFRWNYEIHCGFLVPMCWTEVLAFYWDNQDCFAFLRNSNKFIYTFITEKNYQTLEQISTTQTSDQLDTYEYHSANLSNYSFLITVKLFTNLFLLTINLYTIMFAFVYLCSIKDSLC